MAYTMIAERDNQTVKKERSSALILLANARVWASEGWQVSITDADGKEFDPALIENWLSPETSSPLQPIGSQLYDEPRQDEPRDEDLQRETSVAAEAEHPTEDAHGDAGYYGDEDFLEDEDSYEEDASYEDIDPENALDDQDFSDADGNLIRASNP